MSSSKSEKYKAATPQNNEIDLLQLLAEMFDHRMTIACVTLLLTVCAGIYAFSATPVYQADALIQVEAKQNNSLLKNLTPFGPDLSPDVAPELLLLKSRMILGETIDQLGLTYYVRRRVFPVIGPLLEYVQGRKSAEITIGALTIPILEGKPQKLLLTVQEKGRYRLEGKTLQADGIVGKTLLKNGLSLLVTSLSAEPGTQFTLETVSRLDAINAIQNRLTVVESAKQSGMISLTLMGEDPARSPRYLIPLLKIFSARILRARKRKIPAASRSYRSNYLRSAGSWMKPKRD